METLTEKECLGKTLTYLQEELTHWTSCLDCTGASIHSQAHRLARMKVLH